MVRSRTEAPQRGEVLGGSIPAVPLPPVNGMAVRQPRHQLVSHHLRNDGSAGDGMHGAVPANDRRLALPPELLHRQSVHQNVLEPAPEVGKGTLHGECSGAADVEHINFAGGCRADPDGGGIAPDPPGELSTTTRWETLGIVRTLDVPAGDEDYRSGDHRTRKRSPPDLVNSRNPPQSALPELRFDRKRGGHRLSERCAP